MSVRLYEEDCRAIDLLLDQSAVAAGRSTAQSAFVATNGSLRQRVAIGVKVLGLLDHMPAADPPGHLLNRTLRFVRDASGRDVTLHGDLTPNLSAQPPVV